MRCFNIAEVDEGKYAGLKVGRPGATGVHYAFGGKCAIEDMLTIWKCKEVCHLLEWTMSLPRVASPFRWNSSRGNLNLLGLWRHGVDWGNGDATLEMLNKIGYREGLVTYWPKEQYDQLKNWAGVLKITR